MVVTARLLTLLLLGFFQTEPPPSSLVIGETRSGVITPDDGIRLPPAVIQQGVSALGHTYYLPIEATEAYYIELRSPYFDSYLTLRDHEGQVIKTNDNGLIATHSRIAVERLEADRIYQVDVLALRGHVGEYTLVVRQGTPLRVSARRKRAAELEEAREMLRLVTERYGRIHAVTASRLNDLAHFLTKQRKFEEALPLLEESISILRELSNAPPKQLALALNNLGGLREQQLEFEKAMPLFQESLEIYETTLGPDHHRTGLALNNLASLHRRRGDYARAEPLLERAVEIFEKVFGADHGLTATSLNNLAGLYMDQGKYGKARPMLEQTFKVRLEKKGPRHRDTVIAGSNLAVALAYQVNGKEAKPKLLECLQWATEALGETHEVTATCLHNLAVVFGNSEDFEEALRYGRKALALREEIFGQDHPITSSSLNALAGLLFETGSIDQARELWERALAIREKTLGPEHPFTALSLNHLARALKKQGNLDLAREHLTRALSIHEKFLGAEHPRTFMNLRDLSLVVEEQGHLKEALELEQRGLRSRLPWLLRQLPLLSEQERFKLAEQYRHGLDRTLSRSKKAPGAMSSEDLYEEILRWKGLISRGLFQARSWLQTRTDPETLELLGEQRRILGELSTSYFSADKTPQERDARMTLLLAQRNRIERALSLKTSNQEIHASIDRKSITDHLGNNEAILDFLIYQENPDEEESDDQVVAFVVRKDQSISRMDLGSIDPLTVALRQHLVATAGDRGASFLRRKNKKSLSEILWKPLLPHLTGIDRIYVCPDGLLATLPFETLPGETKETYLIESYSFVYLQGPSDILPVKTRAPVGEGALLAGGLDFDRTSGPGPSVSSTDPGLLAVRGDQKRSFQREYFPLSGTLNEVNGLARRYKEGGLVADKIMILTGQEATESRVKQEVIGKRFVHLATHGFFAPEGINDSLPFDDENPAAQGLPGLLSGIVLSGANHVRKDATEDGILTAEEVAWLDLSSCELVTLSACDTGLGTPTSGENLIGLRRALRLAGARSTITSLWKVSDEKTGYLMQQLYQRLWIDRQGKLESLRGAQLAILARNREKYKGRGKPGSWGAFVLEGDWE